MALINRRVHVNTFINDNLNDAFAVVELVAANLTAINDVAEALGSGGLDPAYYTTEAADALFATLAGTYSVGDADNTFASILNFNTTGILDNASQQLFWLNSADNFGMGVNPTEWKSDRIALQLGNQAVWFTTRGKATLGNTQIGHNHQFTNDSEYQKISNGAATNYMMYNGEHRFDSAVNEATVAVTTCVNGQRYFIQTLGDTDWAAIGASVAAVNERFTATGPGTGTGTVKSADINWVRGLTIRFDGLVTIDNLNIDDAGGYYISTNVEGALQEIWTRLADTANGEGASFIGIEDTAGNFVATTVEDALAEVYVDTVSVSGAQVITGQKEFTSFLEPSGGIYATGNITMWEATFKYYPGQQSTAAAELSFNSEGNYFEVQGGGNITSIATLAPGAPVIVKFTGTPTLVDDGDFLILPGGEDIDVQAGDVAHIFEYITGKWILTSYQKASVVVSLASNAETLEGTVNTKAATPAGLTSNQTLAEAGHMELPGNLIMQWGRVPDGTVPAGNTVVPFNFTFPGALLNISCTCVGSSQGGGSADCWAVHSQTTSQFTIFNAYDGAKGAYWVAIGY